MPDDPKQLVVSAADDDRFDKLVAEAYAIKERFVDSSRKWHQTHRRLPFLLFRGSGIIVIVLGVTLPAIAAYNDPSFTRKNLILSVMSVTIAALTGLNSFFRWERAWRMRILSIGELDALVARWELELQNARLILNDPHERRQHVYRATRELLSNCRNVSTHDAEEFFRGMQLPQSDGTSKGA